MDIPILLDHFIQKYSRESGKTIRGVHPAALQKLMAHHWPGNVRELENASEHAVVKASRPVLDVEDFAPLPPGEENRISFLIPGSTIHEIEKAAVLRTLEHTGGSTSKAAKILNMSVRKIQYKLKAYRQEEKKAIGKAMS